MNCAFDKLLSYSELQSLEQQFGSAFYICSLSRFEQNIKNFFSSFRSRYSRSQLGYSYKTNSLSAFCRSVNALGGYAEVVSGSEYELARSLNVSASKIIFNGPLKTESELERAMVGGSIVNLDQPYELRLAREIAAKYPNQHFSLGIRINLALEGEKLSRFGFDSRDNTLRNAITALEEIPNCSIGGFHTHLSTPLKSVDFHIKRVTAFLEVVEKTYEGKIPGYLDVGGGFFGRIPVSVREHYPCVIPSISDYAEAITALIKKRYKDDSNSPVLFIEPGAGIALDAFSFICKVIDVKQVDGQRFALTAGGIHNVKPTPYNKHLATTLISANARPLQFAKGPLSLVGYTCMEHDRLFDDYPYEVEANDFVMFHAVGAYTTVLKPPFIRPSPAIISQDENGIWQALRQQETLMNWLACDELH